MDYDKVREIRESKGMPQEELAAKCNLIKWDLSRSTLAKIESQVRRVTDEEVALLAKALKDEVNVIYILLKALPFLIERSVTCIIIHHFNSHTFICNSFVFKTSSSNSCSSTSKWPSYSARFLRS